MVIDIIIDKVIGWNLKKQAANGKGIFECVDAFTCSIEEQGRRSLHAHFLVFSKQICSLRKDLHSVSSDIQRRASNELCQKWEELSCTKFFSELDPRKVSEVFDHDCVKALRKRGTPEIVNDQGLRELRANNDGMFAMCSHCPKTWTNTEFVTAYLKNGLKVVGESKSYSDMTRRLRAASVDYQNGTISTLPRHFVQVGYNHHRHAKSSCFKKFKEEERQKRSSVGTVAECRYRYPKKASRTTKIINSTRKKQSWFTWKGTRLERYIKEAIRQRSKYDVFQNISCKSVSYSKLTCNSNLTLVMEGPVGMYNTKYNVRIHKWMRGKLLKM